jgi:Fic family protein
MKYNWQLQGWPNFRFDTAPLQPLFMEFGLQWAEIKGLEKGVSHDQHHEALLDIMVSEAIKSSEIEGEYYSREDVMSSIKNTLGLAMPKLKIKHQGASGIANLILEVRKDYQEPLSIDMLKRWHSILFAHNRKMAVGDWRRGPEPMQVISGPIGREIVHFEAPPSKHIGKEMELFVTWFNQSALPVDHPVSKALLCAAIAHLYFESIHPFENGNGRIGRAISEKALAQELGQPILLSISRTIERNKSGYYSALQTAQKTLQIDDWLEYFIRVMIDAQTQAKELIAFTLHKTRFFDQHRTSLDEKQLKVLQKMWEAGPEGFEGGMNARKYMAITKVSKATATRDLTHLNEIGALRKEGAGRSIKYLLAQISPNKA